MASGPLHGVQVLEFTQVIAGPICGSNLSDLGADVIKVEPLDGDATRRNGSVVPTESKGFQALNRGKRGIALNLQDPRGPDVIHTLVRGTDVVITNYRPGVPERLGIDYDTLSRIRPDLIYWHGTGFGERGPEALRAGSDVAAQAYSGLMAGDEKVDEWDAPVRITCAPFADYMTGVAAAMGISAALHHRSLTGEGQRLDSSLLQSALYMQAPYVMREPVTDAVVRDPMIEEIEQLRREGRSYGDLLAARDRYSRFGGAFTIFYGGYQAKDGTLVLGALTKANRDGARRVLGIEDEESDDPDYDANAPDSRSKAERWKAVVRDTMLTRTVDEWLSAFDGVGVPVSAVQFPEELADDPQVEALGLMAHVVHDVTGPQRLVGPIVNFARSPSAVHRAAPALGADTDDVLGEAGLDSKEVAGLREGGIIR